MSSHMEEETKGDWAVRRRARASRHVVQAEPRSSRGNVMKRSPPNACPNVEDQGRLGYAWRARKEDARRSGCVRSSPVWGCLWSRGRGTRNLSPSTHGGSSRPPANTVYSKSWRAGSLIWRSTRVPVDRVVCTINAICSTAACEMGMPKVLVGTVRVRPARGVVWGGGGGALTSRTIGSPSWWNP